MAFLLLGHVMIYFVKECGEDAKFVKIGYTGAETVDDRLMHLQIGSPRELVAWHTMPGEMVNEKRLHQIFSGSYERGEWFRITSDIEVFIELPLDDQVKVANSTRGDTLAMVISWMYLGFDDNALNMINRMRAMLAGPRDEQGISQ